MRILYAADSGRLERGSSRQSAFLFSFVLPSAGLWWLFVACASARGPGTSAVGTDNKGREHPEAWPAPSRRCVSGLQREPSSSAGGCPTAMLRQRTRLPELSSAV